MRCNHSVALQSLSLLFLSLILLIPFLIQIEPVQAVSESVVKIVPQTSSANIGEEFTINITVENVQNLYGIEVTLHWIASVLQVVNVDVRLGVESHPDGVLHELPSVLIAENKVTQELGKYVLAATSVTPAPPFNGSGNIAKITFNVVSFENSGLDLEMQLYDYPPPDRDPRISLPIEHTTMDGFFEIIPEFPNAIILLLSVISTTVTFAFSKRILRRFRPSSCDSCVSNKTY